MHNLGIPIQPWDSIEVPSVFKNHLWVLNMTTLLLGNIVPSWLSVIGPLHMLAFLHAESLIQAFPHSAVWVLLVLKPYPFFSRIITQPVVSFAPGLSRIRSIKEKLASAIYKPFASF